MRPYLVSYERPTGTVYYVRFTDPRTGKARQVTVQGGRAEAEDALSRLSAATGARDRTRDGARAGEAYKAWEAHLTGVKGLREASLRAYYSKVGRVVRALDGTPLRRWTARTVAGWIHGQDVSPSTAVALFVTTGTFLRWAKKDGWPVPAGLIEGVEEADRPTVRPANRATLTEGQVRSILRASVGTSVEVPVALAALAGLAWGDIRTLRWDEVDLEAGTLWRRQGRHKTGARLRVALAPALVAVLRSHRHAGPLVCRLDSDRATRAMLVAVWDSAAVPRSHGDGWHALRHAFGSHLAAMGVPLPTIQVLMGHAPGSTVTLRYLHPVAEDVTAAAAKIGARFAADRTTDDRNGPQTRAE